MPETELLDRRKIENLKNSKDLTKIDEELKKALLENKKKDQIICVGDSLTGWNTEDFLFGDPVFPVYPDYLQNLMPEKKIINYGFAGALSKEGINKIKSYIPMFPNAKFYIISFGTNDLASGKLEEKSKEIISNLNEMVDLILNVKKTPLLINVPYINTKYFTEKKSSELNKKRDYHNKKLKKFFSKEIEIIDICSKLNDDHLSDELHTNEKGAEIIAKEIYKILRLKL
jgi:lysophospholipase L1-like esterase